jgi:hypothetical protein
VIDALSVALERPILLDDDTLAPLAYSAQWGHIDQVRSESIFSRRAKAEVHSALLGQGISDATDVLRTARVDELDMDERICVPVRADGRLLGYIWILDPEDMLTSEDLDRARCAGRSVAELLARSARRPVPDEGPLLNALCSGNADERSQAVDEAQARHLLPETRVVLCLLATGEDELDAVAVARRAARRLSVGHALAGSWSDGAGLVVAMGDPVLRPLHDDEVAAWLHAVARVDVAVGQSQIVALDSLHEAAHQARIALRVARAHGPAGSPAAWSTLGADRLLAQLPAGVLADVPDGLARLLSDEGELATTLAAFLDHGGDVKGTAASLSLHRSGLYYRLNRIEELTGLQLDSGDDRLLAHAAIRARRLH